MLQSNHDLLLHAESLDARRAPPAGSLCRCHKECPWGRVPVQVSTEHLPAGGSVHLLDTRGRHSHRLSVSGALGLRQSRRPVSQFGANGEGHTPAGFE